MIALVVIRYRDSRKFEYVWICSEIKTIKNIVRRNSFHDKTFNSISPTGTIHSLSTTYYDLLKITTEYGCKNGYRQCGILDTLGNKLCIDNTYPCPINDIFADLTYKKDDYLISGYTIANLGKMSYNYHLYFNNEFPLGNATISLVKTYYQPKYINYYNFILDSEAFQETFGSFKFSEKIGNDNNQTNEQSFNGRRLDDDDSELVNIVATSIIKGIESLVSYSNAKSLMNFMDYLDEKLEENENNVDKYYMNIGDNYYVRNYIGFRSNDDLDKFLKYDFSLHKRLFPNKVSGIFAIICLVVYFILSVASFVSLIDGKEITIAIIVVSFLINLVISLGFLIYSSKIYNDVYKSKDLLELNEIKSEDFINDFIKEYISIFNKRGPIISTIIISCIAIVLQSISLIVAFGNSD